MNHRSVITRCGRRENRGEHDMDNQDPGLMRACIPMLISMALSSLSAFLFHQFYGDSEFEMRQFDKARSMESIRLRIGSESKLSCAGHIGYEVNKEFRGGTDILHAVVFSCCL